MQKIFLIRGIAPDAYGGGESYQLELAKALQENNLEPIIITPSRQILKLAKAKNIKTIEAPYNTQQDWSGWRNILLPAYFAWQVKLYRWYKKQIQKYHPVAINVQSRDEWIAATLAGRECGTKVFWTDHADLRTWVLQNVKKKFKNPIGKYILSLIDIPDKIIAISDHEAEFLKKIVYPKKLKNLVVIKNGVIDSFVEYQNIKPQVDSFCYVGRIVDEKGIKELLEAFKVVQRQFSNVVLNLYGEGEDLLKYREQTKDNPKIVFHGYTDEPRRAIAESEVFILPSYHEGLSIALLEAAMMQKTIIATDVGGNKEVVVDGKTGLLVPAYDDKRLAKEMVKLVKDKKLATKLAKNAREHYINNFDFKNNIKKSFLPLLKI